MGSSLTCRDLNMKTFVCLALVLAVAQAALNLDTEWEKFQAKFEKRYLTGAEHDARKAIFAENLQFINKHNAEFDLGLHTFTVGVNKFADMTNQEFVNKYNGFVAPKNMAKPKTVHIDDSNVPEAKDWRDDGYVTGVKDQGQCGSCWAFSAVATMEGAHFKATGDLVSLSEQQLVDCDVDGNDEGCNGGLPSTGIQYVIDNDGIDREDAYPYKAKDQHCHYDANAIGATFKEVVSVESSEDDLKTAAGTIGPISVGIDASHLSFQLYNSGVYSEIFCSSYNLDHGVTVVGYGHEHSKDYWLVKNSWGAGWGESGYIKMRRNHHNMCGIATMACYAVAE